MTYASDFEAKEMICEYGRRLYARGFVAGNEGNISCRVGENEIYVTPTMESKGFLNPDMLVKMDLDGNIIGGIYKQSSETKMHIGLYRQDPSIGAVIHAHPTTATAFACRKQPLDASYLPESAILFRMAVPVTEFAIPSTEAVPNSVIPYAKTHRALLLGNHGALTWGEGLKDTWFLMETLEQYCKIYLAMQQIGDCEPLPEEMQAMFAGYLQQMMQGSSS